MNWSNLGDTDTAVVTASEPESVKEIDCSRHFRHLLDGELLAQLVDACIVQLRGLDFDTLAFIGYSGAVLAPILSYKLGKELLLVRKNGGSDESNSGRWVEGNHRAKRVVVVDDLICSGKTMGEMMHALRFVKDSKSHNLKIVGLLLHMETTYTLGHGPKSGPKLFLPDTRKFQESMIAEEQRRMNPVTKVHCKMGLEPMW